MPVKTSPPAGTASWYDLSTSKLDECKAFYEALFGWTFEDQGADFGHYQMIYQNGHGVAGMMQKSPEMAEVPSSWTVYYASDDVAADAQRVVDLGGQVLNGPVQVGTRGHMLVVADSTGAVFGLWQGLDFKGSQLENEHGSMCWQEVNTRDSEKALKFYKALFDVSSEPLPDDKMPFHILKKGEDMVGGVLQMNEQWPEDIPPHWMAYFTIANMDEALKKVEEYGGKVCISPFDSPYGRIAVIDDPDGATLSLNQLPDC